MQKTVTFSLDTAIYADGDVLADTQLLSTLIGKAGKEAYIDSVKVEDYDDQGQPLTLVFLNAATSLGTENAAANVSDANIAAAVISQLAVVAGDYIDLGGAKVAVKSNLGLPLFLQNNGSLYVGAISRGTGTYTAAGIKLTVNIRYR